MYRFGPCISIGFSGLHYLGFLRETLCSQCPVNIMKVLDVSIGYCGLHNVMPNRTRTTMQRRADMTVTLQEGSIIPLDGARRPGPDDREGLAQLLLEVGVAPLARTQYCSAKGVRNETKKRGVSTRISSSNGGVGPSWTQAQRIGPGVWLPRNQHQCVGSSSQSR